MKAERNILIAFVLNLSFSAFEFLGGIFTGSTAIVSDAVHDLGDAASIGISYLLERKSKQPPNEVYTYGYARYSVVGGWITTLFLLIGSVVMIVNAVGRILSPTAINYNGMIVFAVVGVCVNFCAGLLTREGNSLNQKAVSLHMLEDVLGWTVVLVGAVVMRFTDVLLIDPLMSIGVSLFILVNAIENLKNVTAVFLEKAPGDIGVSQINAYVKDIDGVLDVHHVHLWSLDGKNHASTMHVVIDGKPHKIKEAIREGLREHGVGHVTVETETQDEHCREQNCYVETTVHAGHHHHG